MPRTVTAAVMVAPRQPIELREFPEPELPPGGLLLQTALSEVCGTDVHLLHGRLSGVPYPIIPGHVSVGRVAKLRGGAATLEGRQVREGDPSSVRCRCSRSTRRGSPGARSARRSTRSTS